MVGGHSVIETFINLKTFVLQNLQRTGTLGLCEISVFHLHSIMGLMLH